MSIRRIFAALIASSLAASSLGLAVATPAAAVASINLDKKAPASVLLGDPIPYTLKATNPAGNDALYNVSFSDVLPAGFEYVGPTDPASAGEPTATPISGGRTLLVWNNVTDLQAASSFVLNFKAKLKSPIPTTIVPVDRNTAYVAGSINERKVPKFNSNGTPVTDPEVVSSTDTTDTKRAPFVVEKKNTNSPEGELLRGVHDQRSIYTLTIRNNKREATNNVTLTDYLPAKLEFLGCGDQDNSSGPEYPGSGSLDVGDNPTPCPDPVSVETVDSPQDVPGLGDLTGVYTAVTWNVGNLAAGAVKEIKYVAGIPLFKNTTNWPGGAAPDSICAKVVDEWVCPQSSNLDNNTNTPSGSTRESIPEQSITNEVSATGIFQGTAPTPPPGKPNGYAEVTEKHTVTIEDLRMQKSVVPEDFIPGGIATFTMNIEASEYMDASNTVVTDTLPNGYCPLGATGTTYWSAESTCTASDSDPKPNPGYANVTWDDASKTYNVVFQPVASITANGSATVTLPARMLPNYRNGDALGARTVAGDNFVNKVELTGTTTPITGVDGGPETVGDTSQAEQGTPLPKISKEIKTRAAPPAFPGGMKCDPGTPPSYVSDPDPLPDFRKGDVICFKLRVDFPKTIDTKNAVVTDFPPVGTEFVVDNQPDTGNNKFALTTGPDGNNVPVAADLSATKFVLTLGTGGFVAKDGVFEATFAVRVLAPGTGTKPEITGNLMKMRTENTAGVAQSYRDQAEYGLVPPPNLFIDKGVIATDKPNVTYPPQGGRLQDNKPIEQSGTATFQIDVRNRPQTPGADYSVRGVQVWDRLPSQLTCSSVNLANLEYTKPGTSTRSALPGGIATCDDTGTGSIVKWAFPSTDDYSIDVGQTLSLIYSMKVPDEAAAGTNYVNTAGVRQYEAFTDIPGITAPYIPKNNIDPTQDPKADSPALNDPSNVFIKDVSVAKTAETSVDEPGNDVPNQATIGETITYTYKATIPGGSTVFNADLSDSLPAGIALRSIVGASLDGGALPGNFPVFDTNIGSNPTGRLVFPEIYSNKSSQDQVFSVTLTAQVTADAAPCGGDPCTVPPSPTTNVPKLNTAVFTSRPTLNGGAPIRREATKTLYIVQPNPSIIKTVEPEVMTSADQELLVTLQVANPGGTRPPLHDWVAKDCLPSPFIFVPGSATVPTGITQSLDANGCVLFTGSTTSPPTPPTDPITGGAFYRVSFKIKSTTSLPASQVYENTATLDSSSMAGDVPGERDYFTSSKATFTSPGLIIRDKTTNPDKAPVGSRFTSTIRFSLIGGVNYYSAAVIDTLPAGIDPGSVQQISFTCAYAVSQLPCDPAITPTVLTPDGQKIGWSAGDVLGAGQGDRVVTIVYSAVAGVADGNVAGTTLTNSAKPFWSGTVLQNPPTTIAGFEALPATTPPVTDTVTLTEPALSIVKKVDGQDTISATPGQTFTYTLKVTNASGPNVSAANDVTITDDIPAGIEVVGSPSDGGQVSSSTITWTINSLAAGAEKTVSFEARLKAPATGKQTNTATVAEYYSLESKGGRKYTGPSDTAEVVPVLPVLTIAKDASAALAYINDPYTWTIVVTNTSGATAYGVDVEDTLPPNWTYKANSAQWVVTGGTPAGKEPTGTAPDIAWNDITDLPSGKTLTITFQATPGPGVVQSPGVGLGTKHTNSALTSWTLGPAGQSWSTATSTPDTAQTEIASADLALTKIHDNQNPAVGKDEVVPGTEFLWILNATNKGPDASMGVFTVEDTLPSGTEFRGYQDGTGWSCNAVGQKVTCTNPGPVNGLAKDASLSDLVLIVYVDPAFTGDMKNTATVNGRTYDPDPDNNKAEDTVTARPLADVAITKTSTKPYVVGGQVTYTLTVTNNGPSVSVAPITVEDTLPTGLSIASIDDGAWDCTPKTGETSKITCTLDKDLARDEQADLIKVTVDVLESPGDAALNKATVTPTTEDPNLGNNTATVEDPVISDVQLGIEKKTTGANPVVAGRSTEFTITVTNAGPAKAKNVQVVDQLEAGLRATSANGPGWTCDLGSGTVVTCTRANFPVSASPSDIVIAADVDKAVPGGTTLKNTATVTTTSPQEGGNPPPAVSTVDVIADSDLAITKTHDGGPWTIGKQGTWRVQVTNNGPSDNPGPIKVVDSLPVGTAFVSATGDGWTCTGADRSLTCELASGLQVGQSSGFSVLVDVVNGAHPRVINTVDVSSPITDSNPANNRATDPVDVDRAKQTADRLPPNPSVLPARKTEQGQKIRTTVRCRPLKTSTAGEASYCRVKRSKNGTVRVKVFGSLPVRVIVTQFAKGTDDYKPFQRVKKYIVRP